MIPDRTRMEVGLFIPPMHYPRQNPTRALQRDLEMIEFADSIGFHEAWIGEHHSSGYEIIGAPDIFIAAAIERTQRIRIGTGVATLPYHHPFHIAERAILLDHLSMGRTMLGVGPGSFPSDAAMLGISWGDTRRRMVESWEAVHHLLTSDEPLTLKTDWFTLDNALLQLGPYSVPTMEIAFTAMESPFGPSLAGKYGASLISLSGLSARGYASLGKHWAVVEEQAALHNQTVDRQKWRVNVMMHVAESREQAKREVELGLPKFAYYNGAIGERSPEWMEDLAGDQPQSTEPPTVDDLIAAFGGTQIACIGDPDDAIDMISTLQKLTGGFGTLLLMAGTDWASQEATHRSLELISREVMPRFQNSYTRQVAWEARAAEHSTARRAEMRASVNEASAKYARENPGSNQA